jgi:hypothetical protein
MKKRVNEKKGGAQRRSRLTPEKSSASSLRHVSSAPVLPPSAGIVALLSLLSLGGFRLGRNRLGGGRGRGDGVDGVVVPGRGVGGIGSLALRSPGPGSGPGGSGRGGVGVASVVGLALSSSRGGRSDGDRGRDRGGRVSRGGRASRRGRVARGRVGVPACVSGRGAKRASLSAIGPSPSRVVSRLVLPTRGKVQVGPVVGPVDRLGRSSVLANPRGNRAGDPSGRATLDVAPERGHVHLVGRVLSLPEPGAGALAIRAGRKVRRDGKGCVPLTDTSLLDRHDGKVLWLDVLRVRLERDGEGATGQHVLAVTSPAAA